MRQQYLQNLNILFPKPVSISKIIKIMKPQSPQLQKPKRSAVCLFIEIALLLTVLMAVFVTIVYYFGTEELHTDIPHALDEIFGTKAHKGLIEKLGRKGNQHAVVWGANETGIFQFLEHYADTRASKGGLVIVKRVENNFYETALKFIRYTKEYIEQNINLESDMEKVEWIFLVREGEPPIDQLQKIKKTRVKDRVVVGMTGKPSGLKGFTKIEFPAVPLSVVQETIVSDFEVSKKEAAILVRFYGTVPEILAHLNEISYTHEKHLGANFQNIKDLTKAQLKTLKALCKDGVAPLQGNVAALEEIGIANFDGKVYWQERINRLNYELSQEVQCVDKVAPQDIKAKILQQREEQSKSEIEGNDNEEVEEKVAVKGKVVAEAKGKAGKKVAAAGKQAKKTAEKAVKETGKKVEKVAKPVKEAVKPVKEAVKQTAKKVQNKVEKATASTKAKSKSKKGEQL